MRRERAGIIALAAGAGAVDLLALTVLGGAFASVVTGNLVTVGYMIGTGDGERLVAVAVAIGGYAAGVALWSLLGKERPAAVTGPSAAVTGSSATGGGSSATGAGSSATGAGPSVTVTRMLVAEAGLLAAVAVGLFATGGRPGGGVAHGLLGVAALAMGAQSVAGLRLKAPTTYLTGALVGVLADLVHGRWRAAGPASAQLASLITGAALSGAALAVGAWWAAAVLPVALVGAAAALLRTPAAVVGVATESSGRAGVAAGSSGRIGVAAGSSGRVGWLRGPRGGEEPDRVRRT
ncbi:DUF1275 family protein [Actinoplanes sp. NPDC051851]|uniref:DUF1275 family protein n=1 Tax=Actinoplanes sp. NPDC051851 TaxID=3154753 RepID=UPI00343EE06F